MEAGESLSGGTALRRGARAPQALARFEPRALMWPALAALVALATLVSLWLRTRSLSGGFWIDEGISVGIASHPLGEIPGVLRADGSPPLYYLLLHGWMQLFGSSESAAHALSLVFATLCIPAALWAGWSLFGRGAGVVAALLAASDPFLTQYSQETRMYTLLALMSILVTATFLHAFAFRRRRYVPWFAVALTIALYTHGWALYLAAGVAVGALVVLALGPDRRRILIDCGLALAIVLVLFGPWLPTLIFQARHTAAPWSLPSTWRAVEEIPRTLLGGDITALPLIGAALIAAALVWRRRESARPVALCAIVMVTTMLAAWAASKVAPAWAGRYFTTFVGPTFLLLGALLVRLRWLGAAIVAACLVIWVSQPYSTARDVKSNAHALGHALSPELRRGDLVLTTHPEQVPVLHYYLPRGLRWATPLGAVHDPRYMDWRDALDRLRAVTPQKTLAPAVDSLPSGTRVAFITPVIGHLSYWRARWTHLVRLRSAQWTRAMRRDSRIVPLPHWSGRVPGGRGRGRLRVTVYVRR